jgi:hypothetical protein
METQTLLYIIIAGIVALLLAIFQYIYKSKKKSKLYIGLAFLRFLTIFSILLLLINPKFEQVTYYNEKPNLVIAVDNSESIAYLNQDIKAKQLLEALQSNEELNANFNIETYSFGKGLNTTDSLSFSESQSNMASIFKNFSEVYSNSVSPTLFITDGNQTYGNDYEFTTNRYKQPIFPIILGDTIQYTDLKVQQLNVNKYAYLKNKFPVEVIAVYNGADDINTQLKIMSGNTTVFSENLSFSKNNSSQIITANLPANRVGVRSYKVELVATTNEKNKVNNIKNFAVEVIDQKTNVAIVSDIMHPDLGALKKSIESNEQRSVTILKPNEFISKINDFQMVILYQPNNKFNLVFQELDKQNTNRFVIAGEHTNWSFLNAIQSNYSQEITRQTENFQALLNQNYSTFIVDDLNFNSFPPLTSEFGETTFSVPIDPILYKVINGTETNEPLLSTFQINNRKEAILLGEGIWKWRAQSYLNKESFNTFDNFIGKLVQYLSSNQKRSRLTVNYESFYNGNDDVIISAQYFNQNFEFDAKGSLQIILKNTSDNTSNTYPFILKNNSYEVDLTGIDSGEYNFTVSVNNQIISKSGTLKILDYNVEQQFLNADVTKLQRLATNSKGKPYFIDNTQSLIDDLINDSRFATIQKSSKNSVSLIDFKYLLALIALSLAFEWFIRKYNGLI